MNLIEVLINNKIIKLNKIENRYEVGYSILSLLHELELIKSKEFTFLYDNLISLNKSYYLDVGESFFMGNEVSLIKEVIFLKDKLFDMKDLRSNTYENKYIELAVELLVHMSTYENYMLYISNNMTYSDDLYPVFGLTMIKSLRALEKIASNSKEDPVSSEWLQNENKVDFIDLKELDKIFSEIDVCEFREAFIEITENGSTNIKPTQKEDEVVEVIKYLRSIDYSFESTLT